MSMARGAAYSFACAAAGSAVWAGISIAADMRLGLLGIIVGGLAGFGMGMGSRGRGGVGAGLSAAAIALVTILLSHGFVANHAAARMVEEHRVSAEEFALNNIAMDVQSEMEESGAELTESEDEFPPEVMTRAHRRWNALSEDERQQRLDEADQMQRAGSAVATGALTVVTFLVDLGLFGFVFVGLGMVTAYKIGASRASKVAVDVGQTEFAGAPVPTPALSPTARAHGFPMPRPEDDEDPLERLKRLRAKQSAAAGSQAHPESGPADEDTRAAA